MLTVHKKRCVSLPRVYKFRVSPSTALRTTPVFDTYWRFARERQEIFFRRISGLPPPWTDDPILSTYRFTNAYRASDRVSQYLIRKVIYEGDQSEEEIVFRTLLFKFFNKIETWELLQDRIGSVTWRNFNIDRYNSALQTAWRAGRTIYSGAYIMPCPPFGARRKHTNHLYLINQMMRDHLPVKVTTARSMKEVFQFLRSYPSLGDFLAYQLTVDLNYSQITNFLEMEFVVAGPGARNGIRKAFSGTAGLADEDVIRAVTEHAEYEFDRLGLTFRSLWGRPLQLIDVQNLFCEVDKYSRVAHPDTNGTGRVRIKQRFLLSNEPSPQWYPPKWRLQPSQNEFGNRITP